MVHTISLTITLYLLWLGLSGHFEPLLMSIGAVSTLLVVYLALRMDVVDRESHPIHLTGRLFRFWGYLSKEILLANLDVMRRVLSPGPDISPRYIDVPLPQKSDLGRVIYANSITLTPGTVSVELDRQSIKVHALSKEGAEDLASGEMARRVPDDEDSPA